MRAGRPSEGKVQQRTSVGHDARTRHSLPDSCYQQPPSSLDDPGDGKRTLLQLMSPRVTCCRASADTMEIPGWLCSPGGFFGNEVGKRPAGRRSCTSVFAGITLFDMRHWDTSFLID